MLKLQVQVRRALITSCHELEANRSMVWMLLFFTALFEASIKASERVSAILSDSSSRRVAAITDSNFRDWNIHKNFQLIKKHLCEIGGEKEY